MASKEKLLQDVSNTKVGAGGGSLILLKHCSILCAQISKIILPQFLANVSLLTSNLTAT